MKFFTTIALLVASVANAEDCCLTSSSACPSGKVLVEEADTMISGVEYEACCTGATDGGGLDLLNFEVCTGVKADDSAAPKYGAITATIGVALVGVTILVAV
mmetsp:Transcript_27416/g.50511  ORF Transcript_27416/g.50511 Transcript_27416/m.50511 type:complete len:102 (+) Transcript_27416:39-344(+)|eukprot:CAMPEP_0201980314 /NCGR_PEP_ID=MMETSP0904-20121228/69939_1 /ASSEMBLY_ACC=CAM_ASM_000553 /TAXON_ID=420261 /ORGANISM="Thalassiosira antarctica, Strain CCMP982" /LENGTH=101 /DNA_ID=CAMNT_0048532561 /DNA_START=140 /DNA_END=445 /DNA_ORIENTATION=+